MRSGFEAARARGLTPFVGREEDLMQLQKAISLTAQGKGQFVSVAGDAGMGKSRLLFEFRHGSELDAFSVLQGSCQPHGRKIPYLPFLNVLRQGLRLRDNDRPVRLVEKIRRNVSAINPALEAYIPHFLHLLSIKGPGHELPEALQGEELGRQLEQAMAAIITMNLQHRPMVMIMEDWHWCDEASDGLLRTMASVVAEYPLMVVASYRQDYAAHWGNLGHHTPIVLKALASPQAERVVRAVAGTSEVPVELMERIVERAEGNPFFIEELSRAMLEQGALSHPQDAPRTAEATRAEGLPNSVQAIIRARTDRPDPRTRSVLRPAAVIGGEFTGTVLERLAPHADELPQALEALKRLELIQQTRAIPEAIYPFNHAITHEVVYEGLLLRQRARLHGQVGETIEALYADRLEVHYESLAFHYGNSANRQKALEYLERAGTRPPVSIPWSRRASTTAPPWPCWTNWRPIPTCSGVAATLP
ncbi:MAG TPA: AAA family ATPase [bacterium]|nr:AAA family ATPase [bacterium]